MFKISSEPHDNILFFPLELIFCVYVFFFLHICLCTTYMPGTCGGPKRIFNLLGAGITYSYELPCGCGKSNLDPLEVQSVFLTTEPSLQSHNLLFVNPCKIKRKIRSHVSNIQWTGIHVTIPKGKKGLV